MKKLFLTLLLGVSVLGMVSCEVDEATEKSNKSNQNQTIEFSKEVEKAEKVNVREILDAYRENGISAFDKYGNKLLEITGVCGEINRNLDGKPYVLLTSGDEFEVNELQCYFEDENEVKELKKGKTITIRGKIRDVKPIFNIPVEDCVIAK